MARILPGAEEDFNEFAPDKQGKTYNGDCGEFAEDAAIHIVAGIPFSPDEMHAIVQREIEHGWASANGGEPLISIAKDLDDLHLLYTLHNYPGPSNWMEILQTEAGYQPVIVEVANGQALAGDEKGLHYHFICVVGINDLGNFLCCDGDNVRRDEAKVLAEYTPDMLRGAAPCGLIVVKYPQKDPFGYTIDADGSITYNASGIVLTPLLGTYVREHNIQEEVVGPEFSVSKNLVVVPFTNNLVLSVHKDVTPWKIVEGESGEDIAALIDVIQSSKTKSKPA
jgi:hypothetical protein